MKRTIQKQNPPGNNNTHRRQRASRLQERGGRSRIRGKHIPIFRGSWQTRADQSQRIGEAQSGSGDCSSSPSSEDQIRTCSWRGERRRRGGRGEWRETNTGNHFGAAFLREIPFLPRKRTDGASAQPMVLDQTKALNFRSPLCFFLLKPRAMERQNDQACVIK
jgi:hypothetical protein